MDDIKTLIFRTDRIGDFIILYLLYYLIKKFQNTKIVTISSEYNYIFKTLISLMKSYL